MEPKPRSPATRLLLLGLLALGCSAPPGEEGVDGSRSPRSQDPPAGLTPADLTPVVFAPGLVSMEGDQANALVYPGGREIYFWDVENRGGTVVATIYVTRESEGVWSTPEVAPFSGTYMDGYIALHPDGSRLYFQSNRPIDSAESAFEYNLWYVQREGDGWSEARPMGRPINGSNHTGGASVTRDGTLYFTLMDLSSGGSEIYRSRWVDGAYQEPERLPDEVNAWFQTCDSYVAPDESYLVFVAFPTVGHTNNPGGLYISFRDPEGRWTPARELGPAFDQGDQPGSVIISPDGQHVFFSRENPEGQTGRDVYWVSTKALGAADPVGGR